MRTEGNGGHSRLAGGSRRRRKRWTHHWHRAPETRVGGWASFIEATLVEKGRKEEKMEEKLETNN